MSGSNLTECGLPGIRHVPYGMHACHFYRDAKDLAEALVPYFIAGLRRHERCLWITAHPLPAAEAQRLIEAAWEGAVDAVDSGALRILDFEQWYMASAHLKGLDVVKLWLEEEERALAAGYTGLRITGNVTFLRGDEDWAAFMEYEKAVTSAFRGRRIVALCSYALHGSAGHAEQVAHAHECTFERPDASWQVLPRLPAGG